MKYLHIDRENRNPEVEERRNLHIGKPYSFQVQTCVYDGILASVDIGEWEDGFVLTGMTLEDGLFFHPGDPSEKNSFGIMRMGGGEIRRQGVWGRIVDEEGFTRVRDRIKSQKR